MITAGKFYTTVDGVKAVIGNESELVANPRIKPTHSYHVMRNSHKEDDEEIAIRYDHRRAEDIYEDLYDLDCGLYTEKRKIFAQNP